MSTLDRLIAIIAKEADKDPTTLSASSSFEGDIGLDSLALVEVILKIEEAFNVNVPDHEVQKFKTLGDVVAYLDK
ncbi:MAG: acyl carrier protein [Proteobacteria bacterium]|nr:acyl carrier protein [Pseudomonadota bacterium]